MDLNKPKVRFLTRVYISGANISHELSLIKVFMIRAKGNFS